MTIPRYQGEVQQETSTRSNNRNKGRNQGYQNLTIEDLSETPKNAKILGAIVEEQVRYEKKQVVVVVKLSVEGKIRLWNLTTANPNLETLTAAFGSDENDWAEKKVQLLISKPNFRGQQWPEVIIPDTTDAEPAAKSSRRKQ